MRAFAQSIRSHPEPPAGKARGGRGGEKPPLRLGNFPATGVCTAVTFSVLPPYSISAPLFSMWGQGRSEHAGSAVQYAAAAQSEQGTRGAEEVASHKGLWVVAGTTRLEGAKAEKQQLQFGIRATMNSFVQAKHENELVSNQYYDAMVLTDTNRAKSSQKVAHGPSLQQLNSTVRPSDIAWKQA